MFSIFTLWTFYFYIVTLQQQLHIYYLYHSWYEILELVIPIMISLIEGFANKETIEPKVHSG